MVVVRRAHTVQDVRSFSQRSLTPKKKKKIHITAAALVSNNQQPSVTNSCTAAQTNAGLVNWILINLNIVIMIINFILNKSFLLFFFICIFDCMCQLSCFLPVRHSSTVRVFYLKLVSAETVWYASEKEYGGKWFSLLHQSSWQYPNLSVNMNN